MQFTNAENIVIEKTVSPVPPDEAWQLESFLLKIFEYGDYSFRNALCGNYGADFQCTFFVARHGTSIAAGAGSLYSASNPSIAIMGPVCVDAAYRRNGLATQLCETLLDYLESQSVQAVYLGVKEDNPAVNLYRKLGFQTHAGIVMRKLNCDSDKFQARYTNKSDTTIRLLQWSDFAEISSLIAEPASMYTVDFCHNIFSAKYFEPEIFLPYFPRMMRDIARGNGCANVLSADTGAVVGLAQLYSAAATAYQNCATLDFFVHDDFIYKAEELVGDTIASWNRTSSRMILSYCLACDSHKLRILNSLGAKQYSVLPEFVCAGSKPEDVIIFKL